VAIKRLLFLIPYLNQNTTSVNRIHSFISEAISREDLETIVLYYDFSALNSASIGIDGIISNINQSTAERVYSLSPSLNLLQKIAFWLINRKHHSLYKIVTVLHQIIYFTDIFTIHKINNQLEKFNLSKNDKIVALGGPFGLFKTATNIKEKYNVKLSIDYRDPWTYGYSPIDGFLLFHKYKQIIIRNQENRILRLANNISTVSASLKSFFPVNFQSKIDVIPNASNYLEVSIEKHPKEFQLIYLGTIYDIQLSDETFFKAFSKWMLEKQPEKVKIIFLGADNNQKLKEIIKKYDLDAVSQITKRLRKDEVKIYLENASIFLHLKFGDRSQIITSKQADYLRFQKPILLPVSDYGDIAVSITENNAGYICNSENEILETLSKLYLKFSNEEIELTKYNDENNSREFWAKKFIDTII
jgi:hypothetical protein